MALVSYFSGPSTPQMRLTFFLLGAALFIFGLFAGNHEAFATVVTTFDEVRDASCGTPFEPEGPKLFIPLFSQSCASALMPGRTLAITCLVLGSILLVRLLYMLIGPKAPSPLS